MAHKVNKTKAPQALFTVSAGSFSPLLYNLSFVYKYVIKNLSKVCVMCDILFLRIIFFLLGKGGTDMNGNAGRDKKIIALVSGGIDDSYLSPLVQSFIDKCAEFNYHVMWFRSLANELHDTPYDRGEVNIYNLINFDRIDALVITAMFMQSDNVTDMLIGKAKEKNIPIVILDGENDAAYNISLEYQKAFEKIVRHVIEKHGAKKLKFFGGSKGNEESDEREAVFRRVMAEYGLPVAEDDVDYAYFWWSSASEAVQKHYDKFGIMPDAFICANDSMAIGVAFKLAELGFEIPKDVIVTGIDGIAEANTFFPSITTIMCDYVGAGKVAALRLNDIFEGRIPPVGNEIVEGSVLFRESCGCEPINRSATDNMLKHELYNQIDLWNGFSDSIITASEQVTGSFSFDETLEKVKLFLKDLWTRECWVCICDDFIARSDDETVDHYESCRSEGYSQIIRYVIHGVNDKDFDFCEPFDSEEMLPDFENVFERNGNVMFLPLHFQERCIGYIGMEFNLTGRNFHILYSLVTNICNALENARIQHEMRMVMDRLEDMYIKDSMTRLYNRRGFYRFAPEIFEKCAAENMEFMVLSVDLDGLKGINDTYGHQEGDNAITTVARALEEVSGGKEIAARFGGDEYIVAGMCPSSGYAEDFIKKFEDYLKSYNERSDKPYYVEASCGVVKGVPAAGETIDHFIKQSDELMYIQKSSRRKYRGYCRRKDRDSGEQGSNAQ